MINYWQGAGAATGDGIYLREPPADPHGYTLAELQALAIRHGLIASAVRIDKRAIIRELENGRPVLIPVQLPAVYVEPRALPGTNVPVMGIAAGALVNRMGRVMHFSHMGLVNHYLLVVGYDAHRFAVVEPVMGYRTISFERLARFRRPFADAALVLSGRHAPAASAAAPAAN